MPSDERIQKNTDDILAIMPWYVKDYHLSKRVAQYSKKTLYEYLNEYRRFLNWLIESDVSSAEIIADIPIEALETLPLKEINNYILFLRERPSRSNSNNGWNTMSEKTIGRSMAALSSLWNYFTVESENTEGEPYFYRNVMKKVKSRQPKETLASRANAIQDRLLLGNETKKFLEFIDDEESLEGYTKKANLSNRAITSFKQNKERDLAFISIMLGSGIRLSETVNLDVDDININTMKVNVIRKGNKKDTVSISSFAKPYIVEYLAIRDNRYKTTKSDNALFLFTRNNKANRLGRDGIEKAVSKYSEAFKIRLTPHDLRHTLATRLYEKTHSPILTSNQLGHSESSNLVGVYAHVTENAQKEALDKL